MISKVKSGEYLLGELVEPKSYDKLVVQGDGTIVKKSFVVRARRIPLDLIREKIFKEHRMLGMNMNLVWNFLKL